MTIRHLYPAVEPSLNLDFANSKKLDSRITFTRGSTATYTDESGIIRTAAQDEARFDHDSDGNSLGLLIEESRTNLVTYSEDFNNAYWTKNISGNGVTPAVTANATTAPDGTLTADKIDFSRGTSTFPNLSYVSSGNISTVQGSLYSGGLWVKAATSTDVGKKMVLRHVSNGAGIIHTLTSDWKRIDSTETASSTSGKLSFGLMGYNPPAYGSQTQPETSISVYVWGAQVETGSFPTSYIPTSGSTVTRSADVASMTGTNFSSWYNQSEGTIVSNSVTVADAAFTCTINDGIGNNRLGLNIGTNYGQPFATVSGTANVYGTAPTLVAGGGLVSFGYKASDYAAYGDATALTGPNPTSVPTGLNELAIGFRGTYQQDAHLNGHISRIAYYPVRLPDATLQALTL